MLVSGGGLCSLSTSSFKIILSLILIVILLLRQRSQRLYLWKLVCCQGMNNDELGQVTHGLIISSLCATHYPFGVVS